MVKPKDLIGGLSNEVLFEAIKICASLPEVHQEVFKNHDNNRWWPVTVKDWRLRMVIAGWSARVSYNVISTYQRVVSDVNRIGYDQLCKMSDAELHEVVGPLGLFKARSQYLKSLRMFVKELEDKRESPLEISNDDLIELFARKVKWASYKVAQCAVLYAKGYHCGVFPVDSGMKDRLGPCLGLHLPRGPIAHEVMRKRIEEILNAHPLKYQKLALETGYGGLAIPKREPPIWWAHLALIYFKRLYCNRRDPQNCPLRASSKIGNYVGSMCDRRAPQSGGYRYVVLEGINKVGKTTVAGELEKMGYTVLHSSYNPHHADIDQHYQALIDSASPPVVFDRIFISEITYGHAVRKHSRLSESELQGLLEHLSKKSCVVLYLREKREVVRERLLSYSGRHSEILERLDELVSEYNQCMERIANYLPVYEIRPTAVPKDHLLDYILEVVGS